MNNERRLTLRITDENLIKRLDSFLESSRVSVSAYIRDLIENDLTGHGTPSHSERACVLKLVESFVPGYLTQAEKLLDGTNQPVMLTKLLTSFLECLAYTGRLHSAGLKNGRYDFHVMLRDDLSEIKNQLAAEDHAPSYQSKKKPDNP